MKHRFLYLLLAGICVCGFAPAFGQAADDNIPMPSRQFFIENKGQWPEEVRYLTRLGGMNAWVTDKGITYDFYTVKKTAGTGLLKDKFSQEEHERTGHIVSMRFKNALDVAAASASEEQPGYYNYLLGEDRSKWATNVKLFKEVSLLKVYEGIDARLYLENGSLRYDMVLKAGADPSKIAMTFDGAEKVSINKKGELVLKTSLGDVVQQKLFAFQKVDGKKKKVECRFVFKNGEVGFAVGKYDISKPLVIDPLIYSTYIGGQYSDVVKSVAVDTAGCAYITGVSASDNYPIAPNNLAVYQYLQEAGDVFVTKFLKDGRTLDYSTFVGGSLGDVGYGIAVDKSLNVYVCGQTLGRRINPVRNWFPTTAGAYDVTFNDNPDIAGDAFVFKLNTTGSDLLYSTFVGGSMGDIANAIAVDRNGNAYITGATNSPDIVPGSPLPGFDKTPGNGLDAFVIKLNATGSALLYATYLGNTGLNTQVSPQRSMDDIATGIAVDGSGNAYVTGYTSSEAFPTTAGAFDRVIGAGGIFQPPAAPDGTLPPPIFIHAEDIFVTKLNANGSSLTYSTFVGGDSTDMANGIAIDRQGNATVVGYTSSSVVIPVSSSYPLTSDAFDAVLQKTAQGLSDACLSRLNPTGTALLYSTFIGGGGWDEAMAIAIDSISSMYATGTTFSTDFPVTSGLVEDKTFNGIQDAFVLKFSTAGGSALYSSFLGGSDLDIGRGIAVDTLKDAYIAGGTVSSNFPVRSYGGRAYDSTYNSTLGTEDGFISKFRMECFLGIDAGRDTVLCPGDSVAIGNRANTGSGLAPYTYKWSPVVELDTNSYQAVARPTVTRKYFLTVTDRIGCISRDSVTVTVNPAIVAEAGGSSLGVIETCSGRDTVLGREATGGSGAGYKYKWTPNNGLSSDTVARPRLTTPATSQKYYVMVTDSRGCTAVDSVNVVITLPVSFSSTSPSGLDFGELSACQKDDSLTFTITNQSGRIVKVSGYTISNSAFKITTPASGFNLNADPSRADAKKTLTVKFAPQSSGTFSDSLQLITEPCGESYTVLLKGKKLEALVKADTNIYNFGLSYTCEPATTKDTVVVIHNSGTGDITIEQPTVTAPYSIIDPTDFPKTVAAGETLAIKVRLTTPAAEGPANAILEVPFTSSSCPASSISIDLTSRRLKATADVTTPLIQLSDITGCDTFRDTVITFTNTSDEPVTISSMTPVAGLQLLGTLPVTLQPGETTSLAVRYSPQGSTTSVQAEFIYGPCDETLTATISGSKKGIAFAMPESITAPDVVLCKAPTSEGTASITNQSGVDVTLREDAVVTGPFTVTGLLKGTVLKNNIPHSFDYTFTPTGEGTSSGMIKVQFDLCEFDTTILLKAEATDVKATAPQLLAMGAVSVGGFKKDSVEIKNTGSSAITITSFSGLDSPFSIITAAGFSIAANSSVFVKVRYDAASEGVFKDTLIAESTNPCEILLKTEITAGEATQVSGTSDIQLHITSARDTARAGEPVNVAVKINTSKNLIQSKATNYTAVISFNKNLLKPTGATPQGTIANSRRIITLSGTRTGSDTLGVLKELQFTALLGDSACTDIALESFSWTDGNATATTSGTQFCLAELCQAGGGTRLISSGGVEFMLYQNKPNPAGESTEIEYSLVEPGHTELILMDMLGRTVKTIVKTDNHTAGRYSATIMTDDIPQGMYIMLLKSPTQSQSLILQVQK